MKIGKDIINAKTIFYEGFLDKNKELYSKVIEPLGPYTLEGVIIYVIGLLFNCVNETPYVRYATLLDTLNRTVISHAIATVNEIGNKNGWTKEENEMKVNELVKVANESKF